MRKILLAGLVAGAAAVLLPASPASAGCDIEKPDRQCATAACWAVVDAYDTARAAAGLEPSYIYCV